MDAIGRDEHGRAEINYDKCVSCGMCLVNCPFGAIVDKGQMFQVIHAIKRGDKVIPIIAPAFWGQFGDKVTAGQLKTAMEMLGFCGIEEVAIGADLCAIEEAEEFLESVPEKQPFMGTSCCPAWSVMAKTEFPGFAPYISMTMTPMVLTARLVKRRNPGCRIAFIGPCAAKKLEASRRSVRSEVDFVLTFEELRGMFEAKDIDLEKVEDSPSHHEASAPGVGFAAGGGVAKAVEDVIHRLHPEVEVKTITADGLRECRQMLRIARTGKYDGYLLEGMACPGGCIAGAGTVAREIQVRGVDRESARHGVYRGHLHDPRGQRGLGRDKPSLRDYICGNQKIPVWGGLLPHTGILLSFERQKFFREKT